MTITKGSVSESASCNGCGVRNYKFSKEKRVHKLWLFRFGAAGIKLCESCIGELKWLLD